jgi:hypothetical protein
MQAAKPISRLCPAAQQLLSEAVWRPIAASFIVACFRCEKRYCGEHRRLRRNLPNLRKDRRANRKGNRSQTNQQREKLVHSTFPLDCDRRVVRPATVNYARTHDIGRHHSRQCRVVPTLVWSIRSSTPSKQRVTCRRNARPSRILDRTRSHTFERPWTCRRPMGSGHASHRSGCSTGAPAPVR